MVGEYTVDINGLAGTFKARERQALASTFALGALSISPMELNVGESTNIAVIVTNNGDQTGTYTVVLEINDAVMETREVTLAGGSRQQVEFNITEDIVGTYQVDVNGVLDTFTVREELVVVPAEQTTPSPVTESEPLTTTLPEKAPFNWWLISGIIAGCVIILGALLYFFVLRKRNTLRLTAEIKD